jgi:pimeloyl-ACP methyl ester carboxylesterase
VELAAPDRSTFVDVNRTTLRVWEWGDPAAPPVVCLHGAYDHGRMFDGLGPALAGLGYRVLAPDLRGHGDSGRLGSGHAWFAVALDIGALAAEAGGDVGLVGHSFGGGQALYVAGVWPELVRWVVNLDGLGPPASEFDGGEPDVAVAAQRAVQATERALFSPPRRYATREEMVERRAAVNVRLPAPWLQHLVEHGSRAVDGGYVWKVDPLFSVGLPGEFGVEHVKAEYAMASCPALVLTGGEHDTWSELTADEVAARLSSLRSAEHVVVEGAGHYVHIEQPDAVLREVERFLAAVGA